MDLFKTFCVTFIAILITSCGKTKNLKTVEGQMLKKGKVSKTSLIVYVSHLEEDLEIFVMNVDGSNSNRLTTNTAEDMYPSWSHDGTMIAFLSDRDGDMGVYTMNADGTNQRLIKAHSSAIPAWSFDDKRLLITDDNVLGSKIITIDLITKEERLVNSGSQSDGFGKWVASGMAIVFESRRDGNGEVYRVNAMDGSNLIRLTENPNLDEWLSWSQDGKKIAYTTGLEGDKDIWIMDADGSNKQILTKDISIGDSFPSWSPDNNKIVFTTFTDNVAPEILVIDIAQNAVEKISDGSGPIWSPF